MDALFLVLHRIRDSPGLQQCHLHRKCGRTENGARHAHLWRAPFRMPHSRKNLTSRGPMCRGSWRSANVRPGSPLLSDAADQFREGRRREDDLEYQSHISADRPARYNHLHPGPRPAWSGPLYSRSDHAGPIPATPREGLEQAPGRPVRLSPVAVRGPLRGAGRRKVSEGSFDDASLSRCHSRNGCGWSLQGIDGATPAAFRDRANRRNSPSAGRPSNNSNQLPGSGTEAFEISPKEPASPPL